MFQIECVVTNNNVTNISEYDLPNGISNDFLLIPKSPYMLTINGEKKKYPAHTAFFIPSGTPYSYATCDEFYTDYFIHFKKDESFVNKHVIPYCQPITLHDPYTIYKLIDVIAIENMLAGINKAEILNSLMRTLFFMISESVNSDINISYYDDLVALRSEVLKNPEKHYSNEYISDRLHISYSYFLVLYKSAFDTTFMQDIINARIERSKHYLAYSNQSVGQIAAGCGYKSIAHFSRQFKKITGMSPLEYRREKTMIL